MRRAVELVGGREKLARALQVPLAEIDRWLADEKKPRRELFLRVVDIIIDDAAAAGESRGDDPPPPRESAPGSAAVLD